MCGLVGFIGTGSDKKVAVDLLLSAQQRGIDATGYVEIDENGRYFTDKRAVAAYEYTEKFAFELDNPVTFLGHTRKATCGDTTSDEEAHPFSGSRYIVFHNGSLTQADQRRVNRFLKIKSKTVDSLIFKKYLDREGSIEKLKTDLLPLLSDKSRYVLVIYDKYKRQVHVLKDGKHPFCYMQTDEGFVYASTPQILVEGWDNKGLKLKKYLKNKKKCPVIVLFPHYYHMVIDAITGAIVSGNNINKDNVVAIRDAKRYKSSAKKPSKKEASWWVGFANKKFAAPEETDEDKVS